MCYARTPTGACAARPHTPSVIGSNKNQSLVNQQSQSACSAHGEERKGEEGKL